MREFYARFNGARLFDRDDPPYEILPVERLESASKLIVGRADAVIARWIAFCDVRDGNYVAADLSSATGSVCPILDCFHETFPDPAFVEAIANSFGRFLEAAMNSDGKLYWLES